MAHTRRSGGVTAWAVLFIMFGLLNAAGSALMLVCAPPFFQAMEQSIQQRLADLEREQAPIQDPEVAADAEASHARLRQSLASAANSLRRTRDILLSPRMVAMTQFTLLLNIVMLIAGIGLLRLAPWARLLAVGQAVFALILLMIVLGAHHPPDLTLQVASDMAREPAAQERLRQQIQLGESLGKAWSLFTGVAWNGLILWFFNRASVKAQFQHTEPVSQPS